MLQGVSPERRLARTVGLSNFRRQIAQTLHTKNGFQCVRDARSFSMAEFIVTRPKSAEHRDWMQSRQYLRRAIETGGLSFPGLVHVVSSIIGVWPFIVFYVKETGKKDSSDSLVVWFFLLVSVFIKIAIAYFLFHV